MAQINEPGPPPDESEGASPSPARDALKSNLDAATDSGLSLKKKKSWFGSLRDVVHKGAMQAKWAVETLRNDPHRAESRLDTTDTKVTESERPESIWSESPPRKSEDSMTKSLISPATPLRDDNERRNKFMSKVASASLRQHISHSSRSKRSSVYSVHGRPSNEMANRPELEQLAPLSPDSDDGGIHTRKSSIAGSLVGSIRSVGRKAGKARSTRMCTKDTDLPALPALPAQVAPLPSSPINIPAAAPALDLDLGPTGFMPPEFGESTEKSQEERVKEMKKLTDPANITTGVPMPTPLFASDKALVERKRSSIIRPATPKDLLNITIDDVGPSPPPPGPATPMPGTNFTLEIDGTNSEKSDKSHVFERSVTPSVDRKRGELRKMRSLDAMAEACTIAHANDELVQMAEASTTDSEGKLAASLDESSRRPPTPRRQPGSSETTQTLHSCPDDMPELTRQQVSHNSPGPGIDTTVKTESEGGNSVYEDPFDDSNAIGSGPPSPERSVKLPFRPKVQTDMKDGIEDLDGANDGIVHADSHAAEHGEMEAYIETAQDQENKKPNAAEDPFQTIASEDDTNARAQQLLTSDIIYPDYENVDTPLDSPTSDGLSPHPGPLIPQIFHNISTSQNSSPRSARSRTTYTAGLGEAEFQFSLDNWLRDSSNAASPDNEPSTPQRRRMDMSLDSVSTTEERKTPLISPTTTSSDRTPSMGNRLEFNLKRSERNGRCNALHQRQQQQLGNIVETSRRGPPQFIVGVGSDKTETIGIRSAEFENNHVSPREATPQKTNAGSYEATPQKKQTGFSSRIGSEDSVADSLKNAAFDYYQLEERLACPPTSDDLDVFADPVEGADCRAASRQQLHPTIEDAKRLRPSSAESPSTITSKSVKARVTSSDTLDRTIDMFGSSESGYQADESSVYMESSPVCKTLPARYRSRGKRRARPLGEMSHNVG